MKVLRSLLFIIRLLWVSPLLLPFYLTTEKEMIFADVKRWVEVLSQPDRNLLMQLLLLLQKMPEYRNLYYFRICQGNMSAKAIAVILKLIYPHCQTLFLEQSCQIGPGLFIQHGFSTIVMADIGKNGWINQQVTIGHKDKLGRPSLGDHVRVTAGAKVLGNIEIGHNVTVGANAVVVKNVPDNCVVVGIPARIIKCDGLTVQETL